MFKIHKRVHESSPTIPNLPAFESHSMLVNGHLDMWK